MPTSRQQMMEILSRQECSVRDLSRMLGIREKEVYDHLSHIQRSVASRKRKLVISPSRCLSCGYVFETRKRFTRPSRCPHCRSERIQGAKYKIVCISSDF
ncbi:MAG: transcriptional regulator [Deltaproteobacteria bacterium]|nr:MAG: transcriptional regulator [Deltaproteobacteria bacterium]RLC12534.1 MAG: transcriptional regulator [Deltaproteobacteria bacterium]